MADNQAALTKLVGQLLATAIRQGASDIHFRAGQPPMARINGDLTALSNEVLSAEFMALLAERMTPARLRQQAEGLDQIDFSAAWPDTARFRVHRFRARGEPALVLRIIPLQIPDFATLRLPAAIKKVSNLLHGLVLVTGATGMGKSTTIASLLEFMARTSRRHILTIEDPLEFVINPGQSLVSQREVGKDVADFVTGLWAGLREDPDVIFLGEIRDAETVRVALQAAETGHLVVSTIHTGDAPSTIEYLINLFPTEEQTAARLRLATVLEAAFCQRLLPMKGRAQRVLATEVLLRSASVQEWIRRPDKPRTLLERMEQAVAEGMQTLDTDLRRLYEAGLVELEVARMAAHSPSDFVRNLSVM